MSASQSLAAYEDCIELFDRALASKIGIWVQAHDPGQAFHIRTRMNYCRKLLRLQSMEIYTEGDPEYGVSPYESLYVTVKDSTIFIKQQSTTGLAFGEIPEDPPAEDTSREG
jgi:hypothetical protein